MRLTRGSDGSGVVRKGALALCTAVLTVSALWLSVAPALAIHANPTPDPGGHPWDVYNLSPTTRTATPVGVTRTTGSVADSDALLRGGAATLQGKSSSVTLDFGKEVGGAVSLHFADGTAPTQQLGLAFTESSQYIGSSSDASNGGVGADGALLADAKAGSSWTTPPDKIRGGFRYLTLFANSQGPITVDTVSLHLTFDPTATNLRAYANHFYSNDPLLNRIWYAGAYTAQTNTIAPTTGRVWGPPPSGWNNGGVVGVGDSVLVDGAKRDRTVWPGDLGVSVPTEFASLGDTTPTRNALTTLYQHQRASGELPFAGPEVNFYGSDTYHLWTLIGTTSYYEYSHDVAWMTSEWSNYQRALSFSLAKVGSDGLMSVTGTADWARSDQGGENIEANALLYRALITGSDLAKNQGDHALANTWSEKAATLKKAANAQLWDDAARQYRDNPNSSLHPQDGNSLAVWYGLADSPRSQQISATLTKNWNDYGATTPEKNSEIGTFPGSLEVQAHLEAGDSTRALDLIRREWGYMLNSPLGTGSTFWEGYLANGQFGYGGRYMSASHGWATGPTSALTFYVLGIRPQSLNGGYDIKPQPGDLTSTEGSLKTPLGNIELAWKRDLPNRQFTETLDAPLAAVRQVEVPTFGDTVHVTVNGKLVWNGNQGLALGAHLQDGYVVLQDATEHSVIVSRAHGNPMLASDTTASSAAAPGLRVEANHTVPFTLSEVVIS